MGDVANWQRTAPCPCCGVVGTIRRIIYGYPLETDWGRDVILNGCIPPPYPRSYGCTECDWRGEYAPGGVLIPELSDPPVGSPLPEWPDGDPPY